MVENPALELTLRALARQIDGWLQDAKSVLALLEPLAAEDTIAEPKAPEKVAPKKPSAQWIERARRVADNFRLRSKAAELRATIRETTDLGFPSKQANSDLKVLRERQKIDFPDTYVFGLAEKHQLEVAEWKELSSVYDLLAREADAISRRGPYQETDRPRIERLAERFARAAVPCGADLNRDDDVTWLANQLPAVPETLTQEEAPDQIVTTAEALWNRMRRIAVQAASAPVPQVVATFSRGAFRAERCRLKSDVAKMKARLARAEAQGERDLEAKLMLDGLRVRHKEELREDGYVYGFSADHRLEPEEWERLSRAYLALAATIDANAVDEGAARAALDLFSEAIRPIRNLFDEDAIELRDYLNQVAVSEPEDAPEPEDRLAPFMDRLANLPEEPEAVAALVVEVLDAGVRPSDPRLREALLDWTDDLADLQNPAFEALVRELRAERDRRIAAEEEEPETGEEDEEYLAALNRVREHTEGKRLLLVGGACREPARRAIEETLGLSEAFWPDSDEHQTKPADFDVWVDRSDVVVKTRFCRRGYQRALERAREQGKPTAALKGGYNPRQVVRSLADAWRLM